jgi:hypothetical protein
MPELTSELPDGAGNALFGGVFELHHSLIGAALRSACVPDWNASSAGDGGIAKRNRIRLYSRPGNDSPIAKSASGRSRTNVAKVVGSDTFFSNICRRGYRYVGAGTEHATSERRARSLTE